jgi:flavin-dependent dehydrogenase
VSDTQDRDVIVIGGGPAGSSTAALLAMEGHRVALLEREPFPRFRIGESLMPATYWTFQRLGVLDRLKSSPFVRKESVQFFAHDGRAAVPFYFEEVDPHESSATWQVERGAFDQLLMENASEKGVEVHQPASVTEVILDGERAVGVRARFPDGRERELPARVVVDATGQNAMLSRRLELKQIDPELRHTSFFTRYRGARREAGRDEGATLILHTANSDSWFWFIPLPGDLVSVGVVGHIDHLLRGRAADPQKIFHEELAICPELSRRLQPGRQVEPVQALLDFSYISKRIAGDGWVLVGDAFGFLDPIYSSGVFLALKGAELAADSIHAALDAGDVSAARLGRHGDEFIAGVEALRRLVYAYYDPRFSFARFLKKHPGCREDLVNLLMGNVYRRPSAGILEAMAELSLPAGYEPLRLAAEKA